MSLLVITIHTVYIVDYSVIWSSLISLYVVHTELILFSIPMIFIILLALLWELLKDYYNLSERLFWLNKLWKGGIFKAL